MWRQPYTDSPWYGSRLGCRPRVLPAPAPRPPPHPPPRPPPRPPPPPRAPLPHHILNNVRLPGSIVVNPPAQPVTPAQSLDPTQYVPFRVWYLSPDRLVDEFLKWACFPPLDDASYAEESANAKIVFKHENSLHAEARSHFGFDPFVYEHQNALPPSKASLIRLKQRIVDLLIEDRHRVVEAIATGILNTVLGDGFEWVRLPSPLRAPPRSCTFLELENEPPAYWIPPREFSPKRSRARV